MSSPKNRYSESGFSLVELLIVAFTVALIVAVLVPALATAKEHTRRTVCLANIHQFLLGLHVYAQPNDYRLPFSNSNTTFQPASTCYVQVEDSAGSDECMFCPAFYQEKHRCNGQLCL